MTEAKRRLSDLDPKDTCDETLRKDLLFRSIWHAEGHTLSMQTISAIFQFGKMYKDNWSQIDLRNWIHILIAQGDLELLPNLQLKLSRELAEKAGNKAGRFYS